MPLQRTGGGAGLEIGDYIETERTVLPDGKRLLPLDGSILDSVEYPLLAAIMTKKPKLIDSFWVEGGTFEPQGISPDGSRYFRVDPTSFIFYSKDIRNPSQPSNQVETTTSSRNASYDNPNGTQLWAMSDDGQYRYGVIYEASGTDMFLVRSTDNGSSYTNNILVITNAIINPQVAVWCSSNGQNVIVATWNASNEIVVQKSTDFGATFNNIITEASGSAYENIRITDNGTFVLAYSRNSSATKVINTETPAVIATITTVPISFGYLDITNDGAYIATSGTLSSQGPSLSSTTALNTLISNDNGATFDGHVVELSPFLGNGETIAETRGGCHFSSVENYLYHPVCIVTDGALRQQCLAIYDYINRIVVDLIRVPEYYGAVLANANSAFIKCKSRSVDDADRFAATQTDNEYGFTINYDQYLMAPFGYQRSTSLLKVVADAPAP